MRGGLLVAGTTSDAGKSVVAAGVCRWLRRKGVSVAPFKAMNMSNNSVVTGDGGRSAGHSDVGRGLRRRAHDRHEPVLLKPGDDRRSHVVVRGRPFAEASALSFRDLYPVLRAATLEAYDELAGGFDVVVCEGAGGAAEINLRATDLANLGLATARHLPTVVVGDIDRGGVLAGLFGTLALLSAADQALLCGFVVNKFRGDPRLLGDGLDRLSELTGRPVLGVLPWREGLTLDVEDSLSQVRVLPEAGPPLGAHRLRVAAVRLPRTSNATDVEALAVEPGVSVCWTASAQEVRDADLVVLPGTRATVADLGWLHGTGIAEAVTERARAGRPVLGVCGGYQMLAERITDGVESAPGTPRETAGLSLRPVEVRSRAATTVGRPTGQACGRPVTTAYEIHHGVVTLRHGATAEQFLDGFRRGAVWGTTWHGALESDGFRRAFLCEVAELAGRDFVPAPDVSFAAVRAARLDALGDLVADHLDTTALGDLIDEGPPENLPFVPPGVPT